MLQAAERDGKSDATGSAPAEDAVHPTELLATIYHAVGIDRGVNTPTARYGGISALRQNATQEPQAGFLRHLRVLFYSLLPGIEELL